MSIVKKWVTAAAGLVMVSTLWSAAVTADVPPAEMTVGEREFCRLVGRECRVIRLWPPGQVPDEPRVLEEESVATEYVERGRTGLLRIQNVSDPAMIVVAPMGSHSTGRALVLCPGGGYGGLASESHVETARRLNEQGITLVLLKYRVPKRGTDFPMNHQPVQDAQRALSILRTRAAELGLDPDQIGVAGVSAGGHLAASLSINHQQRWYAPLDDFDVTSCRPDFVVLFKPAYLTDPINSRTRDTKLHLELLDKQLTPPTTIFINRPDKFSVGATEYYLALKAAGVPAELHVYPEGGHGEPLETYPFDSWQTEWLRFLDDLAAPARESLALSPIHAAAAAAATQTVNGAPATGDQAIGHLLTGKRVTIPLWDAVPSAPLVAQDQSESAAVNPRRTDIVLIRDVARPTLTFVPPTGPPTGQAVIVCPGGGYGVLAAQHEGTEVCEWLARQGIAGILLKYRVPKSADDHPKHLSAVQDLQRAMRVVRSRAAEWKIEPDRIGVCGFSAGGHACAVLAANPRENFYAPATQLDRLPPEPNFCILVYPAYLTEPRDSDELDPLLTAMQRNVTPPTFITVAEDDSFTRGALNGFLALHAARIATEVHVYHAGGHGGGMRPASHPTSQWIVPCERWLHDLLPE